MCIRDSLVQKPLFILCNAQQTYSVSDYIDVMWHGASLDATTTGYLDVYKRQETDGESAARQACHTDAGSCAGR